MCDSSYLSLNDKYLLFETISCKLRRQARTYVGGCGIAAEDLLADAREIFVCGFECLSSGEGGAVAYAQLCLRMAARKFWRRQARELPLESAPVVVASTPESIWERIPPSEQVGMAAEVIRQVLAGRDLAEAGKSVGWSPVQTSRELARLGQRITGDRPARYTSRRPVRLPVSAVA